MSLTLPLAPEIIWFTPSESYIENPTDTLQVVSKAVGCGLLCAYYGFAVDDPNSGVWVLAWDTLAAHQSFMELEVYIDFALPAMDAMVGPGRISQALLSKRSEFIKAVSSPITQFVYITVRPRHDRNYELVPLIERALEELAFVQGYHGSSWGPAVELDNVYVGVVGWGSIADRDRAVKGLMSLTYSLVHEVATVEVKYARLRQHKTT